MRIGGWFLRRRYVSRAELQEAELQEGVLQEGELQEAELQARRDALHVGTDRLLTATEVECLRRSAAESFGELLQRSVIQSELRPSLFRTFLSAPSGDEPAVRARYRPPMALVGQDQGALAAPQDADEVVADSVLGVEATDGTTLERRAWCDGAPLGAESPAEETPCAALGRTREELRAMPFDEWMKEAGAVIEATRRSGE